jgi:nucleotide-binding universal stress UspA family protein
MRILLAIDGSPASVEARDVAAGLPWPADTTIRLLTAYQVPVDWTGGIGASMAWVGDAEDALRDEVAAELEELAQPFADRGVTVERRLERGRAADVIVDAAREMHADLIIVGSRGHGPLQSMLLGSVSAEVVDHAPCPVLVTRSPHINRLLVATDGSDVARSIPDVLGAWGVFRGLPAEAISVAPSPERTFEVLADVYTLGAYDVTGDWKETLERHRRFADELAGRLSEQGLTASSTVLMGDPTHEITEAARRRGTDLIVTGSRGLHGLERIVLGSVARNVLLHAPCSVLVMRSSAPVEHHQSERATVAVRE